MQLLLKREAACSNLHAWPLMPRRGDTRGHAGRRDDSSPHRPDGELHSQQALTHGLAKLSDCSVHSPCCSCSGCSRTFYQIWSDLFRNHTLLPRQRSTESSSSRDSSKLPVDNQEHLSAQWGSVDYHKQSLRNLQKACQQTKRMCAVILDTVGRELMIRREFTLDHEVHAATHLIIQRHLRALAKTP